MDVTNPGLVNVADEVEGNPDPNSGTATATPRETAQLVPVADQEQEPPPGAGADAEVFPTPVDVDAVFTVPLLPVLSDAVSAAAEVDVNDQSIGQGGMVPVDPGDPAAGYEFRSPGEFVVVGPATSFQTNATSRDQVSVTVTDVFDADNLFNPPGPATTRYYLRVAPPSLTSYPVSMLGRQVTFDDSSTNPGAVRSITNFGGNFVVVNKEDNTESNGDVVLLVDPVPGDVFMLDVQRYGSEQTNTPGETVDVTIAPSPEPATSVWAPLAQGGGTTDVSTGPQPAPPPVSSGTRVPSSVNVEVADQCQVVGLPVTVFT